MRSISRVHVAFALSLLLAAASCAGPGREPAPASGMPVSLGESDAAERAADLAARRSPLVDELDRALPAAVDIMRLNPDHVTATTGSGSIIHESGYVLSVNHMPMDASVITPYKGKRYRSRLIAAVPGSDLAIGKIDSDAPFPFLPLGRCSALKAGDPVIAIGGPGEHLIFTVSTGPLIRRVGARLDLPHMVSFGNSGGPVLDSAGNQIGVVQSMTQNAAVGFATDMDAIRQIVAQALSESECGVRIGLSVDLTGDPKITGVQPGSPAEKAGLRPGDVLARINHFRIGDSAHYHLQLSERRPGERITVEFRRAGETKTAELTVEPMPSLGVSLKLEKEQVIVGDLVAGSSAEKAGLKPGDVFTAIDGKKPQTLADIIAAVQARKPGEQLAIRVLRGGAEQRLAATLGKRPCKAETLPPAKLTSELPFLGIGMAVDKQQVTVSQVTPGSAADTAGIKVGDVVAAADGKKVQTPVDLANTVQSKSVGDAVSIELLRAGQKQIVKATLGRQP